MSAAISAEASRASCEHSFLVRDYDLDLTLASGQVFGWRRANDGWTGVVQGKWVRLRQNDDTIRATMAVPCADWSPLADYLQVNVDLDTVLATFPSDEYTQEAAQACRGLRLLRQDPWECLAGFILSSTKQIVQIEQIIFTLRTRYGTPVNVPHEYAAAFTFPSAARLASANEADLRACKMGFRAPNLLKTARLIADGTCDLERLRALSLTEARAALTELPGIGEKIADCVLLFAYGFPAAFPVDVWIARVLRQFYWPRRRKLTLPRLRELATKHFGPNAGYAQQYLFHHIRTINESRVQSLKSKVRASERK